MRKLKDINWNHLYCFYEVSKAQSLKKAAESIGIAPSTLSEQLKKLESKFHQKLFERSSKGLTLSNDGLILYDRIKDIFEEGSKLLEHYSDDVVGGYSVTVGIEETISYDLATEFTSQYWDLYAQYGIVNTQTQSEHSVLVDNLIYDNIDWAISVVAPKRKSLNYQKIDSFEVAFCCSTELFNMFHDVKDLLRNIPIAMSTWDKNLNRKILQHLRKNKVEPKEKIYSDHPGYVQKLCERSRCVMLLPINPLEDYPNMKIFHIKSPIEVSLYAIWKKQNEGLISIRELQKLINSRLEDTPSRYEDVELQIEASDIDDDLLKPYIFDKDEDKEDSNE